MKEIPLGNGRTAKADAKDKWGSTPLDVAAGEEHEDIVELFRKNAEDANADGEHKDRKAKG